MDSSLPSVCNINNISTIKQSTYYYCAAACIQMCIGSQISQDDIYKKLHESTIDKDSWYADPDSVYEYLKKYLKIERTSCTDLDSKEVTERIISSFAMSKVSAPMLVLGGRHWVLYSGYQIDERGELKGIYIRDPWPTAAPLTFYPFSDYFFNDYFCKIDVEGKLKDKVESFVAEGTRKIFNIDVIRKPKNGGYLLYDEMHYFKRDLIRDDLMNYGFNNIRFLKNGGSILPDCIVKDSDRKNKFLLSFLEINDNLSIVAVDLERNIVIGCSSISFSNCKWYNKDDVIKEYGRRCGEAPPRNEVEYVFNRKYCKSCFDPIIEVRGKKFSLNFQELNGSPDY